MLGLSGIVAFAHKLPRPIVHRDLKPANVLVQPRAGEVALRVTDFGIGSITAEQARRETQRTTTAATGGADRTRRCMPARNRNAATRPILATTCTPWVSSGINC
jgi:serine/threonine protein kinase